MTECFNGYLITTLYHGKRPREDDEKLFADSLKVLVSSEPNIFRRAYRVWGRNNEIWIEIKGDLNEAYNNARKVFADKGIFVDMVIRELEELNFSGKPAQEKHSKFYNYADLLYDRGILHESAKVVEGCVGSTGWTSSLQVAKYLGRDGEFYMVELDGKSLSFHRRMFSTHYEPDLVGGRPKLEWVAGAIEDQQELIKGCDALLFHNYIPVDGETLKGKKKGSRSRIKTLFGRLVEARSKHIVFFLPRFKHPEFAVEMLDLFSVEYEVIDGIHYAGELEEEEREEWKGQTIIAKLTGFPSN